ncbi:MAG: hypothetical protein KA174_11335 [Chitinophagales bacterium]|nr:hypothetical protein [Chitinophagales bacterium]
MKKRIILLFVAFLIAFGFNACINNPTENPVEKRIKQSFKVHDDNVNNVDLRKQNISIREVANFYYNTAGLLDSLNVFSDSTPGATLLKSIKFNYLADRVRARIFFAPNDRNVGDFFFNSSKQVTKIVDTSGLDLFGIFFSYTSSKITNIRITVLGTSTNITNFVYDGNNNLQQYILPDSNNVLYKIAFTYDLNKPISSDLDIRFASAGIQFLYAGGVNVISLIGLNTGVGNMNRITDRVETKVIGGEEGNVYQYEYSTNNIDEIVSRKITINDTVDVFYDYRY